MNYPCPIIRDLLPLYLDEVLSPESTDAVEQHLRSVKAAGSTVNRCAAARSKPKRRLTSTA